MKRVILGIIGLITAGSVSAQVTIQIDGAGADVSGTIVEVNVTASTIFPLEEHFVVTNNTGSNQVWKIKRVIVSEPAGWDDDLCWPPQCYLANTDPYTTPAGDAPTIIDGTSDAIIMMGTEYQDTTSAEIKPRISPDQSSNSTATYMYYIVDGSGTLVDSVGLQVNFTLGIDEEEIEPLTVEVVPNPASEYLTIQTKGTSKTSVKMVDVLGNVVFKEVLTSASRKIDVSTFRNGVYFVIVESENNQVINRKVIVRH